LIVSDTLSWFERMADSEIYRRGESLDYGKTDPNAKWNYQTGLFLKALMELSEYKGNTKYFTYAQRVIDSYLDDNGNIKTYKMNDFNIDKINSGKVLLRLYKIVKDDKYKKAAFILREQLDNHPRTKEGGFWHKKRYPWQMWLDGIYMGSAFYAEFSNVFNQPDGFDDVAKQILLIDTHTRDPKTGLRYHGWDESNQQKWADPETGCSPNFWGRGMGWYAMALVDILDYFPENHDKRQNILFILNDLIKSVVKYQDKNSGLWYQVVDQGNRDGNYLEASASSMFVYAIAKAVNKKYIEPQYWKYAEKGFDGLIEHLIEVEENGLINLTQVCSVAGLGGDPYRDGSYEYYLSEPVIANDLKGVGPFIMAGIQIDKGANIQ
ncbi:MAG: glycoside hydrolase family 88 protein, partial [Calditrichaceae bacterium]|nr:glycoside hydrolase family 88 protein [Calditrichaceae bacterium]